MQPRVSREIAAAIQKARAAQGISIRKLAELARTSPAEIQRVLAGKNTYLRTAIRVADAVRLTFSLRLTPRLEPVSANGLSVYELAA